MNRIYRFPFFFGACFGAALAGSGAPLTLADALQRATDASPILSAQRHSRLAADALIEQAGYRPNPTIEATLENVLGTGDVRGIRGAEATVLATQTLERGGKRQKRVALANRERELTEQELAVLQNEILSRTAVAYVGVLAARQRLALAEAPLRLAVETLAAAESREKAGAASTIDVARARAAVAAARGEVVRARALVSGAQTALAAIWGGGPDDALEVAGTLRVPDALPDESMLLSRMGQHPRVALQRAAIESRQAAVDVEVSMASQDVSVGGGLRFLRDGSDAALVASVSIPLAVRNRNQGRIRAAREEALGAGETLRAVRLELKAAFDADWQELKAAHATALGLRRDVLPANEDAFDAVKRAYDNGELAFIDVLDAQRTLLTVQRELLEAEASYVIALARIEGLTATRFPGVIELISAQ
ncbi:MAG: TolC family protein [Opitutaceae bacterium]|nr:TolC family protein [Opitutaceae bacterium]